MKIDIVIPTYNSEASVEILIQRLEEWNQATNFQTHFIFIDDASSDNTFNKLKQSLSNSKLSFEVHGLHKNQGQHTAVALGLGFSSANLVVTMDDDLQHNPFEIERLYQKLIEGNHDLVYGTYASKKHNFLRNLGTKALQFFLKLTDRDYSMVTSFRIMKKEVCSCFKNRKSKVYFIEEFLLNASASCGTVTVTHHKREIGESNYSGMRLVKMAVLILLIHSSFPLKFISRLGVFLSLIFFGIGIYYIRQKLLFNVELGYTSIIVSIFFSTGLILFSLGTIGEYIRKIWLNNQHLDLIVFKENEFNG
ncbi:MAG: glycosyltransferase family 2 protein [Flavobacteriales bacterium]|nr:glycosyltransferase family 2 protein [Flavobacteriales bacterium]